MPLTYRVCMYLVAKSFLTLYNATDYCPPGSSDHGGSPGNNTGVGCHYHLQGIFLTHKLNPRLLHWQADSLPLSYPGSPTSVWIIRPSLMRWPFFKKLIYFYWRIIALQNFAVFCQTSTWIPPFWNLPISLHIPPPRLIQSPCLSFLSHTANSHRLSILHIVM